MTLTPTIPAERLWDGEMIGLHVDGVPVLIVNVGGELVAYRDMCVHQAIRLSEGKITKDERRDHRLTITCRAHQWTYDAATGQGVNPSTVCLTRLACEVRANDGMILVDPHRSAGGGAPSK